MGPIKRGLPIIGVSSIAPCLFSWDFRTLWTFSLLRTLGLLPLEVFPSDAGILWDRLLNQLSLPSRFSNSLADCVNGPYCRVRLCGIFHLLATSRRRLFMLCRSGWCLLLVVVGDGVTGVVLRQTGSCSRGIKTWGMRREYLDRRPTAPVFRLTNVGGIAQEGPTVGPRCVIENGEEAPRGCSSSPASFA